MTDDASKQLSTGQRHARRRGKGKVTGGSASSSSSVWAVIGVVGGERLVAAVAAGQIVCGSLQAPVAGGGGGVQ